MGPSDSLEWAAFSMGVPSRLLLLCGLLSALFLLHHQTLASITQSWLENLTALFALSEEELEERRGLEQYFESALIGMVGKVGAVGHMLGRLPNFESSSMGCCYRYELHRQIRAAVRGGPFDFVFAQGLSAAQYAPKTAGVLSMLDFGDMHSRKWLDYSGFKASPRSFGYRLETVKRVRAEKQFVSRFNLSNGNTRAEFDTLNNLAPAIENDWFTNAVASGFFGPSNDHYDWESICLVDRIDYHPDQQAMLKFCAEVLPLITARKPKAQLTIVGAEPSRDTRTLKELPRVTVAGTVPDVRDYVRGAAASVVPLVIARDMQNQIFESMAMGVPVASSRVASNSVDAVAGEHMLTADSSQEYAQAVIRLLDDRHERTRLAESGRQRVLTNHSWSASMQKLDDILMRVTGYAA